MKLKKIFVHAAYPLWRKNALVGFARAKQLQDQGHDVTVTYCNAKCGVCVCNEAGNPLVCTMCHFATKRTAKKFGLPVVALCPDKVDIEVEKELSISERKEIVEGVLSAFISSFRLLPKDIRSHRLLRWLKRRYYVTSTRLLVQMKRLITKHGIDEFEVFNGRHACSKFGIIAAKQQGKPFNTLEVTAAKRPIIHLGHTAHDRVGIQKRVMQQEVDWQLAEKFFSDRQHAASANQFAKHQCEAFEVPDTTGFDRMVPIFLSSQDEFASLGKAWKSSFDSEHLVLMRLCQRNPRTLFCIRFHPNQAGIRSDITWPYQALEQMPNVRIYYPQDQANTYDLLHAAHTVIAFNSTVAVEACWIGKPVIMIGPSFYDSLDVAYTPANENELHGLMCVQRLEPKDRTGAAKLAYYVTHAGDDLPYLMTENKVMKSTELSRSFPLIPILARNINTLSSQVLRSVA
ncbi:Capsule polysaccharide biosynthesis protein [Rosistilla oblonga]|uniref:capsular polysaccharide export protein, LipB/KpsS family n=1 Tax=Rosistilla oblonga TaxID=2527990 RepID=UPI0011898D91|nr:hypothetical protein [Rosistilla oblonga]QDV11935.1 Capsule polysaccharide biosynthesis protein [Rosistilla oblonga]